VKQFEVQILFGERALRMVVLNCLPTFLFFQHLKASVVMKTSAWQHNFLSQLVEVRPWKEARVAWEWSRKTKTVRVFW